MNKNIITPLRIFFEAYENYCKPICKELQIPQMAFDILMFFANNTEYHTAKDLCRMRGLKENIVSVNVNKLVGKGYLMREEIKGDRRKIKLSCTEKAQPIIEKGRKIQDEFQIAIRKNISPEEMIVFQKCLNNLIENAFELSNKKI